jgi:hypothetical protein
MAPICPWFEKADDKIQVVEPLLPLAQGGIIESLEDEPCVL